jgi:hypothetical protein
MSKIVCVIWDIKSLTRVGTPLTFFTEPEVRRWAVSLLDKPDQAGLIGSTPEDFELWLVAVENEKTPQLEIVDAKMLFRFSDFSKSTGGAS